MEQYEHLTLIDMQLKLGFKYYIKLKRKYHIHYSCTKSDSKQCMAKFKIDVNTGKVVDSDLAHNHSEEKEPYGVLKKIGEVDMDGAAGD